MLRSARASGPAAPWRALLDGSKVSVVSLLGARLLLSFALAATFVPFVACSSTPPPKVVERCAPSATSSVVSVVPCASSEPTIASVATSTPAPTELVPLRHIDREEPSVTIAYPVFELESAVASDTINAVLDREALASERWFVSAFRDARKKGKVESPFYLRRACQATFLKPRITSVRCTEVAELGLQLRA